MRLAIDTNSYLAFMQNNQQAIEVVQSADRICVPVPVLAELRYGFLNGTRGKQNEAILLKFLDSQRVEILTCTEQTTHIYAMLKLQLKKQGTPIPINDIWIAALVLEHRLMFFTYDRDFDNIPQLPRL